MGGYGSGQWKKRSSKARKAGKAGIGDCKVRGDSWHYVDLRIRAVVKSGMMMKKQRMIERFWSLVDAGAFPDYVWKGWCAKYGVERSMKWYEQRDAQEKLNH